jgi:hypothetical protein
MSLLTVDNDELGSKDHPHPITPNKTKDRTPGHYYMFKGGVRCWGNGRWVRDKEKKKEYNKKYRENNPEYNKEWRENNPEYDKEYRENNKESINEYKKEWRENNPEYDKEYRENNKERLKEYKKEWNENNKERLKEYKKEWNENNKEYYKEYHENNKERRNEYSKEYHENNKERRNEYSKERYRTDPIFRLTCNVSSRALAALKSQGASKNHRTMEYVGCSVALLYYHLEAQFEPWMTWDNLGVYDPDGPRTWQIDHRRPCDSFDLNDEDQQFMCFNWTNLQPLCSKENVVDKNNNFDPETFQYKWMGREIGWVGIPSYLMGK